MPVIRENLVKGVVLNLKSITVKVPYEDRDFSTLLEEYHVQYKNSGQTGLAFDCGGMLFFIDLVKESAPHFASLAAVITAYLARNKKKKVFVRVGNKEIEITGYSPEQIKEVVSSISSIDIE
ncbi:hypothetical protein [Morganella morganii]